MHEENFEESEEVTSGIFKEYINYHNESIEKYGPKTVVFLHAGTFYEMYAFVPDPDKEKIIGPDLWEIKDILNISVTKRNKSKTHSIKNLYMAGVQVISKNKFANVLLNEGYTVVIVDQITSPPNPRRGITEVLSPGTSMQDFDKESDKFLISFYIDSDMVNDKEIISVGASLINIQTGKNYISNIISNINDVNHGVNEMIRILNTFYCIEIVIHKSEYVSISDDELINLLEISNKTYQIDIYKSEIKSLQKINYQNNLLKEVFKLKTMLSSIEYFDLERKPIVVLSYVLLIKYIHLHKADLINGIEEPIELNDIEYLTISSDGITQLNVCNNNNHYKGKANSLLTLLNKCKCPMGKRVFKERLLHPTMNPDIINNRYNNIEIFMIDKYYEGIRRYLGRINDLDKSLRKICIPDYDTVDLLNDHIAFENIIKLIEYIKNNDRIDYNKYNNDFNKFNDYYEYLNTTFNFDNFNISINTLDKPLFKEGNYLEIDTISNKINKNMNSIQSICEIFSKLIDEKSKNPPVRFDYNDKDDYFIFCTKKRFITIEKKFENLNNNSIYVKNNKGETIYEFNKNDIKSKKKDNNNNIIDLDVIRDISKELVILNNQLQHKNKVLWDQNIKYIQETYYNCLKNINEFIADVDFICCGAYLAVTNNYHKPNVEMDAEKSFIVANDIRHPIIENISEKEFIRNNICIGKGGCDGILLYGINAGGKSTLMKAIGLNLIMAQSGLYVASGEFIFKPYQNIFTRIISNDNIFKAHSSFVVECLDINSFLNGANENSLILGDEVCSTTEVSSALSLVASALHKLSEKKSSFMFTSHLSELVNLPEVQQLSNLRICHLSVTCKEDKIIFNRKLQDGIGEKIYGIKVAESLGLDKSFIAMAKKIQLRLNGQNENIINTKQSVYNSNVLMDKCEIPECNNPAQETHHIFEQSDADEHGNTGHFHKNKDFNLVPLCKECHAKITYGNLHIHGWLETSDGMELKYEYIKDKQNNKKKKFSLSDVYNIKQYYERFGKVLTKKKIIDKLENDKCICVSSKIFNQIIKGEY